MKKPTLKKAKALMDKTFSEYMRKKHSDPHTGNVKCYTCPTMKHWKEMQLGHFCSRSYLATRFDELNCRIQCVSCNVFKSGNYPVFALNLTKENPKILEVLNERKQQTKKFSIKQYEEMILDLKQKIKDLGS